MTLSSLKSHISLEKQAGVKKSLVKEQSWLSHGAIHRYLCIFSSAAIDYSKFGTVHHYLWEFNILQKLLTRWAQHDRTLQETFTFTDKGKLRLVIQIQEALWRKLKNLYLAAMKKFKFQKRSKNHIREQIMPTICQVETGTAVIFHRASQQNCQYDFPLNIIYNALS